MLSLSLLPTFVCCVMSVALVTPQTIIDTILDPMSGDPNGLDTNNDGLVDVADVVFSSKVLPNVSFSNASFVVSEGQGSVSCEVVTDADFTGVVQYEVSGTSVAGTDYSPLTGNMLVDGSNGIITVPLLDDAFVESTKTLILSVKPSVSVPPTYALGANNSIVIILEDDDAIWRGQFVKGNLVLPFVVTITQIDGQVEATLESDGTGMFPSGSWPAVVQATPNQFTAVIGPIEMQQSSSLLNATYSSTITLTSDPNTHPEHVINFASSIEGSTLEEHVFSTANAEHLDRVGANAIEGSFILLKDVQEIPEISSELTSLP